MSPDVRHFEDFELDPSAYRLSRNGEVVRLERIPLELLCLLVERCGHIVSRAEILERIWGKGVFIDNENAINTAVRKIRRALNDDADAPRFIVTIPSKGYRFVAPMVANGHHPCTNSASEITGGPSANGKKVIEETTKPGLGELQPSTSRFSGESGARKYRRLRLLSLAGLGLAAILIVAIQHLSLRPPSPSASARSRTSPTNSLPIGPAIAVLPFANLSGDPRQDYFSDGITDELITDLSRLPNLFVIARMSSFIYKGKAVKAQDVAAELGVKYLLEGSVNRAGDRIRINVQLVKAGSGNQVWAHRYDKRVQDVFELQDDIVSSVIATLGLQLYILEKGSAGLIIQRTNNLEAYDYYLRGLESYFITTPDAYADAREMFEKAITLDPNYADAYATLAFLHFVTYLWQWDAYPRALDHAEELAGKAISLDSSNASAYAIRGWIAALRNRSYEAIADGQRAVALEPSNALACSALADIFNIARKPEEALAYAQRGLRLDPGDPEGPLTEEGFAYSQMGRYRESINALRGGQANNPWIHLEQVYNYSELGREQDARAELAQVLRLAPKFSLETVRKRLQGHWDNAAGERYLGDLSNAGLK